jgi:hypothetical protein
MKLTSIVKKNCMRTLVIGLFLTFAVPRAEATNILVYDLFGGFEQANLFGANPGSWTFTVVPGTTFASLTAAQIAAFDVIWVSWLGRNSSSNDGNAGLFANAANLAAAIAMGTGIVVEATFGSYGFLPGTPGVFVGSCGTGPITAAGLAAGLTQTMLDGSGGCHGSITGWGSDYTNFVTGPSGTSSYVGDTGGFGGRIVLTGHDPDWHAFGFSSADAQILRALIGFAESGSAIPEPATMILLGLGLVLLPQIRKLVA